MVIAKSILGVKLNAIGSEVTATPAFIETSELPLNFNSSLVDTLMVVPPVDTAI
jgi:hypothetical protein